MARLVDRSFVELLAGFRSSDPTPGGGSAAALAGAVGSSLLTMVSSLPKPRAESESDQERLRDAGERCARASDRLAALIDRDTEAYDGVVAAYRLPKASDADKASRAAAIQAALRAATDTPLDVMRECHAAITYSAIVGELGNRNASSDVRVALELLLAGLHGADHNVEINLGSVKDAVYVESARAEASRLTTGSEESASAARDWLKAV
jgi:formiminotetrahydrofolate cyclodeaminase